MWKDINAKQQVHYLVNIDGVSKDINIASDTRLVLSSASETAGLDFKNDTDYVAEEKYFSGPT